MDIPADREECEEKREHEPPRALPVLSATLQTISAVNSPYRAEAQAQLQAGGQFDFKSLGFVLAVRNVVRESKETYADVRTGVLQLIGGKDVRFVTRGRRSVWIHQRHLEQSDMLYELEHSHLPFVVRRVLRVEVGADGGSPMVTLEMQSELSNFTPYEVTHTLAGWKRDLTPQVGRWVECIASRREGPLPAEVPVALGKLVHNVRSMTDEGALDWHRLLAACSLGCVPILTHSGPTLVIHLLPGVEHRAYFELLVSSWFIQAPHWRSRIQLAPHLAHPKPDQTSLLPSELPSLAASVRGLFVAAHTDGRGLVLSWPPNYMPNSGLCADVHRPGEERESQDSMARGLQELIGQRRGLFIVLLCCGLSEPELRSLERLCGKTDCFLVLPGAPTVEYTSPLDLTLREFSNLVDAYTRVAVQLNGLIPANVGLQMARELLPATSRQRHPPIFVGPRDGRTPLGVVPEVVAAEPPAWLQSRPAAPPQPLVEIVEPVAQRTPQPRVDEERAVHRRAYDKVRKERPTFDWRVRGGKAPVQHVAQLRAVQLAPAELLTTLPRVAQQHIAAQHMVACTAEVHGFIGPRTLLFTCQGLDGGDKEAYRKRTVNLKARLNPASSPSQPWQQHHVSSADVEELLRLYCLSVARPAPPELVRKANKMFVLQE